jgi:hypothetical protein
MSRLFKHIIMKKQGSVGRKALIGVMAALGLFSSAGSSQFIPANNSHFVRSKDALNNMPTAPKPQSDRKIGQGGGQSLQTLQEVKKEPTTVQKVDAAMFAHADFQKVQI